MSVWLITGCSSGLGRSLAEAVLKQGDQAIITARKISDIQDIVDVYPDSALALQLDVTDHEQITQVVQQAEARFGQVDVLVNNAGYGYRSAVEEADEAQVDRLFATNFFGPVAMIKAILPSMRARRSGTIMNVSSIAARNTAPGSGYYAATKCALEGMSRGLKKEVDPLGIKVIIVEPGAFKTEFSGRSLEQSKITLADYAETSGKRRKEHDQSHGLQPGDPFRGAQLMIKAAESVDPPSLLLLGSDAVRVVSTALEDDRAQVEAWKKESMTTDFSS